MLYPLHRFVGRWIHHLMARKWIDKTARQFNIDIAFVRPQVTQVTKDTLNLQSVSIAWWQGLLESFCGSSPGKPYYSCCAAKQEENCNWNFHNNFSSKPCDRAIDALCIYKNPKKIWPRQPIAEYLNSRPAVTRAPLPTCTWHLPSSSLRIYSPFLIRNSPTHAYICRPPEHTQACIRYTLYSTFPLV